MKLATSTLTDVVTIHAGDDHRVIRPGETVDLDEVIGETRGGEKTTRKVTVGELLGPIAEQFTLEGVRAERAVTGRAVEREVGPSATTVVVPKKAQE